MSRKALLGKAASESAPGQNDAAIVTAGRLLQDTDTAPSANQVIALLIRAEVYFERGDRPLLESELSRMLDVLPRHSSLPELALDGLMMFTVRLGANRILELIQESPARVLLEPLVTALRQELGKRTSVSKEVEDVASNIRKRLIQLSTVQYRGR